MKQCTLILVLAALLYVASWPFADVIFIKIVVTTAVDANGAPTTVEFAGGQHWFKTFYRPLHRLAWGSDGAALLDSNEAGPLRRFHDATTSLIRNTECLNRLRVVQVEDQTGSAR